MKKVLGLVLCVVLSVMPLGGCAILMAGDGADNPDLSFVRPGESKFVIDSILGKPKEWVSAERFATYRYTTGSEASESRSFVHALADGFTFFAWEIIATPYELLIRDREAWYLGVWYTPEMYVERLDGPHKK